MNSYLVRKTAFGPVAIAWRPSPRGAVVCQVFLSDSAAPADDKLRRAYPGAAVASCPDVRAIGAGIRALLAGANVEFDLDLVDLDACPPFQRAVLRATHGIPRGRVSTYGLVAAHLDKPGAARAVGNALADNPFPLLIPCHRVVRGDGALGGFGGGPFLKNALLTLEDVAADDFGRIRRARFHYAD